MGNAESKFFWYPGTFHNYGITYKFPIITGTADFMETCLKLCKLCIFNVKLKLIFFIFLDLKFQGLKKNSIDKMRNNGILPQFANIVCIYTMLCNLTKIGNLQKFMKLLTKLIFKNYFIQSQFREN